MMKQEELQSLEHQKEVARLNGAIGRYETRIRVLEADNKELDAENRAHCAKLEAFVNSDMFAPDWANAPTWAMCHIVDDSGVGVWYEGQPTFLVRTMIGGGHFAESKYYTLGANDWRNSLRFRP